jgi:23S rRNA A1618 N6-methylase RlmF
MVDDYPTSIGRITLIPKNISGPAFDRASKQNCSSDRSDGKVDVTMMPRPDRKRRRCDILTSDFQVLAGKNIEFRSEWSKISQNRSMVSQATPAFQLALTRALLDHHFGLTLQEMPSDCLIPPVPNRWFYVEWIQQELIPLLSNKNYFSSASINSHRGLDIGTGASCIYPLLATTKDASLCMIATDVDPGSIKSAMVNVEANGLTDRIQVLQVDPSHAQQPCDSPVGGPVARSLENLSSNVVFDFCMTNPPFFDSTPAPRADGRARTPMTDSEGTYPGGEVGFVLDMIRDSLISQQRIGWYSTMLGKKTSLIHLQKVLRLLLGVGRVQTTELHVGTMTRWFLAWTYHSTTLASPATLVTSLQRFQVEVLDNANPVQEVVSRVCDFFSITLATKHNLECDVCDSDDSDNACVLVTEKKRLDEPLCTKDLPERLVGGVDWSLITPFSFDNHFLLKMTIQRSTTKPEEVRVSMASYKHTFRGSAIDNFSSGAFESEIRRTNRRWKRKLQREAHATNVECA